MKPTKRTLSTSAVVALFVLVPLTMPSGAADTTDDEYYAFTDSGTVAATVHYADGIATTKMGFFQITGTSGTPSDRLSATAECTEWIGTFSQVLVEAGTEDNVNTSDVRILGGIASPGAARVHTDVPFVLDALGGPLAYKGSLLVCDDPVGDGLIRLNVDIHPLAVVDADPGVVRLQLEEGSA